MTDLRLQRGLEARYDPIGHCIVRQVLAMRQSQVKPECKHTRVLLQGVLQSLVQPLQVLRNEGPRFNHEQVAISDR